MSRGGTNGVMDGLHHAELFNKWVSEVSDFRPFISQGTLNVSRIASESGLQRNVFYTNPMIRDDLMPTLVRRLEAQGTLSARMTVPTTLIIQKPKTSGAADAVVKQIQEQNDALKAENSVLRKELQKHKAIKDILTETGRLPW